MSKGLGCVEKQVLEILDEKGGNYSASGIYFEIMTREHRNALTDKNRRAKNNSVLRAIQSLERKDYVTTEKLSRKEFDSLEDAKKEGIFYKHWYLDRMNKPPSWVKIVYRK